MALVRRANVVLDIKDDQVDRYLDMGYSLIDKNCRVIKESTHKDVESLVARCDKQEKQIKALEENIKSLEEDIATYTETIENLNIEIDALNEELEKAYSKAQPKTTKSRTKKSE